jgi:hypothetical protein
VKALEKNMQENGDVEKSNVAKLEATVQGLLDRLEKVQGNWLVLSSLPSALARRSLLQDRNTLFPFIQSSETAYCGIRKLHTFEIRSGPEFLVAPYSIPIPCISPIPMTLYQSILIKRST